MSGLDFDLLRKEREKIASENSRSDPSVSSGKEEKPLKTPVAVDDDLDIFGDSFAKSTSSLPERKIEQVLSAPLFASVDTATDAKSSTDVSRNKVESAEDALSDPTVMAKRIEDAIRAREEHRRKQQVMSQPLAEEGSSYGDDRVVSEFGKSLDLSKFRTVDEPEDTKQPMTKKQKAAEESQLLQKVMKKMDDLR